MVSEGFINYRNSASDLGVEVSVHDGCPVSGQGPFKECEEQHSSGVGRPHHGRVEVETPVEIPLSDKLSCLSLVSCENVRALSV